MFLLEKMGKVWLIGLGSIGATATFFKLESILTIGSVDSMRQGALPARFDNRDAALVRPSQAEA